MATWCTSDRVSVMAHVVRRETDLQRERKSEKLTMRAHERLGCNQLKSRACRWAVALSEAQSIVTTHAPSPKRDHWCTMWPLAPPLKAVFKCSCVIFAQNFQNFPGFEYCLLRAFGETLARERD